MPIATGIAIAATSAAPREIRFSDAERDVGVVSHDVFDSFLQVGAR